MTRPLSLFGALPVSHDLPGRRPCTQPLGPRTWSVWACDACRPRMCSRMSTTAITNPEGDA
jgi:hypothetical protein